MTVDHETQTSKPPPTDPFGPNSRRVIFTYNDAIADCALKLDGAARAIQAVADRLRMVHEEFALLPEVHERELAHAKAYLGDGKDRSIA